MKKTAEPIQLLPHGWFLQNGIAWSALNEDAMDLLAKLRSRIDDYVVDYEHKTMMTHETGLPAPAAGWVKPWNLQWRPDEGLYGVVEWTANAKPGDYEAVVPCFDTNHGGVVKDILLFGLSNDPKLLLVPAPVELRYKIEWTGSAALRSEFCDDIETYRAYRCGVERQRR